MKKIYFLIAVLVLSVTASAQVQLTQFFMDGTLYNPALTGSKDAMCSSFSGRQQWIGFNDPQNNPVSPLSMVFNLHAPVYSINSGIGVNVIFDKAAFETNTGVKLNYAYRIPTKNEKNHLGIGIGVSVLNRSIAFDKLITEQQGDPLLKTATPESGILPDFDFGLSFQTQGKFSLSLSAANILQSSTDIGNVKSANIRHYYLMTDYRIKVKQDKRQSMYIIPAVFIKSNSQAIQFDVSTRVEVNNRYWGGLSYRYQDAVAVIAGLNFNGLRVGASYDLNIGKLAPATSGSAEIFIGYCHPITPKVKMNSLYNTRYL
jgi:type IX secretion system PorP/SprF family membrane protein